MGDAKSVGPMSSVIVVSVTSVLDTPWSPMTGGTVTSDRAAIGAAEHTHICIWKDEIDGVRWHEWRHRNGECMAFPIYPCGHEIYWPTMSARLGRLIRTGW